MATLNYKTRGNSNPQGKPRVYFCCHNDDFEKFFESISDEILSLQNCSVWYKDDNDHMNEELLVDLKEMQLFVMPVTTKLLCTENDALDVEFKFAVENHIPVLPLMQHKGLEQKFKKKCGELQFLVKDNSDPTAISYEDKLQKYLKSVLIGDEMAEKIRAAFDAYVFLSYRKKDRKHAQELMRLIHKNEFCRDIAIWYDEFLTPGENFNNSIKEALQKSGLFVLTVTPNLVNEINYIMTTEYPMAKQEGKPILPAELVPTDREKLSQKYEDIPNVADAYNDSELSNALLQSIKKMAIKENDKNPEHNFFIGLAYLGGVDVEVDHEKALSLITSAAEAGLPDAIRKLSYMYNNGEGVKKNQAEAVSWYRKLLNVYDNHYKNDETIETAKALLAVLLDFGDLLYQNKRVITLFTLENFDEIRRVYKKALEIAKKYDLKRELSTCYKCLGNMEETYNDDKRVAREYYKLSMDIDKSRALESGYLRDIEQFVHSCYNIGNVEKDDGNFIEAKKWYKKALTITSNIVKTEPSFIRYKNIIAYCSSLKSIAKEENDLLSQKYYLEKELAVEEILYNHYLSNMDGMDRTFYLWTYSSLGDIYNKLNDVDKSKEYYELAIKKAIQLLKEKPCFEVANYGLLVACYSGKEHGVSYELIEEAYSVAKNLANNRKQYEKTRNDIYSALIEYSVRKCTELVEYYMQRNNENQTEESKIDVLVSYVLLAKAQKEDKKIEDSVHSFKRAIGIAKELLKINKRNNINIIHILIVCYCELVHIEEVSSGLTESFGYSAEIAKLLKTLFERHKLYDERFFFVIESCVKAGDCAKYMGIKVLAEAYYKTGIQYGEIISQRFVSEKVYCSLEICKKRLKDYQ